MIRCRNVETLDFIFYSSGELSMRISGSLVWNFSPSDGSPADNILTAYHPDRQPEPTVEGKEFIGKLNLAPSEDHGYGAIKITDFQGVNNVLNKIIVLLR